jgi:hypothetical protein
MKWRIAKTMMAVISIAKTMMAVISIAKTMMAVISNALTFVDSNSSTSPTSRSNPAVGFHE